jgi:3-dehydroquinate dehydratase
MVEAWQLVKIFTANFLVYTALNTSQTITIITPTISIHLTNILTRKNLRSIDLSAITSNNRKVAMF